MPTTQTVTYDPTNDSIVEEANEARDAENLEVGEKMMAEQDNLLAGKYKTTEDLEKGYKELESRLGKQEQEATLDREETKEEETPTYTKEDLYTEDGSVNYDTANELYGEQVSNIFKENEIDPFKMNDYFQENNGTLSDDMYATLDKAGLNKNIVDSYLECFRQQVGM